LPVHEDQYWFSPDTRVLVEECGVFGIHAPKEDVARQTFFGLYTLQHRGQESAGIAVSDGNQITSHRKMGLVSQVFTEQDLASFEGIAAIGHTRYSTTGSSNVENAQPVVMDTDLGRIAMGHNGNLVNAAELRREMADSDLHFEGNTDSELIAFMVANGPGTSIEDRIKNIIPRLQGSFSLVFLTANSVIAVRDELGNRPLCLGRYEGAWLVSSESCAFEAIDASFERDLLAGEILVLDDAGPRTISKDAHGPTALCVFEYIYFARPDSVIEGSNLHEVRQRLGASLAIEHPITADVVIGVPDSATAAAIGYSNASGIPYGEGLVKSRYIGRTFIQPDNRLRKLGIKMKLNTLSSITKDKRVIVVDDSIVRGNTTRAIVELLRTSGQAAEVHVRISSPPMRWPCFYGIDIQRPDELIANSMSVEEICHNLGADSLGYLSLNSLIEATQLQDSQLCTGCLTRNYPIPVQLEMDKLVLERPDSNVANNPDVRTSIQPTLGE